MGPPARRDVLRELIERKARTIHDVVLEVAQRSWNAVGRVRRTTGTDPGPSAQPPARSSAGRDASGVPAGPVQKRCPGRGESRLTRGELDARHQEVRRPRVQRALDVAPASAAASAEVQFAEDGDAATRRRAREGRGARAVELASQLRYQSRIIADFADEIYFDPSALNRRAV